MENKIIDSDAGKILGWLYQVYEKRYSNVESGNICKDLRLNKARVRKALDKLYEEELINAIPPETPRAQWKDIRISTHGVDIIRNKDNYKRHFGIELNLGIIKVHWGAEER